MEVKELFEQDWQCKLNEANQAMESLITLVNDLMTPEVRDWLNMVSKRVEQELQLVSEDGGFQEFQVKHFLFPVGKPC